MLESEFSDIDSGEFLGAASRRGLANPGDEDVEMGEEIGEEGEEGEERDRAEFLAGEMEGMMLDDEMEMD